MGTPFGRLEILSIIPPGPVCESVTWERPIIPVGIILSASNTYDTIRLVQAFKDGNFLGVCKPA
jgi:hypothetical protein